MAHCSLCNASFIDTQALKQHIRDSPAHNSTSCDDSNRRFGTLLALEDHLRNSAAHAATFDCRLCNKSFKSEESLEHHVRDSPAHAPTFDCDLCNKTFKSEEALEQHTQNSPAHTLTFDCDPCNKTFKSQDTLDDHIRDSAAHNMTPGCALCNKTFKSREALDDHVRDSPAHLTDFHRQEPNISRSSAKVWSEEATIDELDSLAASLAGVKLNGGATASTKARSSKKNKISMLQKDIETHYGGLDKLGGLQRVCADVGLDDIPTSASGCKKALTKIYVNIFDLIKFRKTGVTLKMFSSRAALQNYSIESGQIYPKHLAKADCAVRPLLINMFSP